MKTIEVHGENVWIKDGETGHWLGKGDPDDTLTEVEVAKLLENFLKETNHQ